MAKQYKIIERNGKFFIEGDDYEAFETYHHAAQAIHDFCDEEDMEYTIIK